ncbi:MAG: CoA transferase, partial [Myxococcales bacterium]
EPFQAGGRITEWIGGTFASVAALAAVRRARATGQGEHIDFSLLESMIVAGTNYMAVLWQLMDAGEPVGGTQTAETPSIEPTSDGWVGFCTNSRQQISDFMVLIGRPELRDDEELAQVWGRMARFDEWNEIVHAYTTSHTTAEIIEAASLLRIPVAPVNDGRRVFEQDQLVARGALRRSSCGTFLAPRPPLRMDDTDPPPPGPAPKLDEHRDAAAWKRTRAAPAPSSSSGPRLPLSGLRILDMTAWWAGPSATHTLATLGADVIHLESVTRPDGMRLVGGMLGARFEKWWDASWFFQATNTNKRGLTLDLAEKRGLDLAKRLIEKVDGVIENFTPRVLDGLGLGWDVLHAINPQTILVRMPAFGLTGPWRDYTGFAQTMEQLTGLAWITGHRDDQPRIQRGPCDPIAGMHAAYAFLVALAERDRRGEGVHVECTMVEAALNAAAEAAIEYSAYGTVLERLGNRSPGAAPQGLYACADGTPGQQRWLALSVETDVQWAALAAVIGAVAGESDAQAWSTLRGRVAAQDRIDELIRSWSRERSREDAVDALLAVGVPAAPAADPRAIDGAAQVLARGFFEEVDHPVTGRCRIPGVPFRYRSSVERWIRSPAPVLGQHNREILEDLLGVDSAEVDHLERDGVIGTELRPR